ncbi:MAG: hypothetical protein HYW01_07090 [Deltaproteobacteria bacterium]|nr:hypothetical protein [Deltaproteobacteria bacterium]
MNPLIIILKKLLERYGNKLPPLEEREQLWKALAETSNEAILTGFKEYVETNASEIHDTLLGEIGRILYD